MAKTVELRRHTANDGDSLTDEGVRAALEIGRRLSGGYDIAVSSGAQRATQTIACLLAAGGLSVPGGVVVDPGFRSEQEPRWFEAARRVRGGDLRAFIEADPELVRTESVRFAGALRRVLDALAEGGRALVVGHSPMHEAAVYGLCDRIVAPISKGAGVLVVAGGDDYGIETVE